MSNERPRRSLWSPRDASSAPRPDALDAFASLSRESIGAALATFAHKDSAADIERRSALTTPVTIEVLRTRLD